MVFVVLFFMFLTAPTVEELKQSDLQDLVDMLLRQTIEYSRLIKREGMSSQSMATREMILNLQAAIETKKVSIKSTITR
jgi:hypothetical protein